jgi:7-carboxy-7-deazaguanine synthase
LIDALEVSEVFGPTFQGEGPSAGRRCGFVRLGRCNLHCSWCDADYTWAYTPHHTGYTGKVFDPAVELAPMTAPAIMDAIQRMGVEMVVVTGGEPLVQQKRLAPLLTLLTNSHYWVEMETNGTIAPAPFVMHGVNRFNVSPKLANSGNGARERYNRDALLAFRQTFKAAFKFVVASPDDLDEIDAIAADCALDARTIWLMPEGCDTARIDAHMRAVAAAALERGWNMTSRLQVSVWGDRRGV